MLMKMQSTLSIAIFLTVTLVGGCKSNTSSKPPAEPAANTRPSSSALARDSGTRPVRLDDEPKKSTKKDDHRDYDYSGQDNSDTGREGDRGDHTNDKH